MKELKVKLTHFMVSGPGKITSKERIFKGELDSNNMKDIHKKVEDLVGPIIHWTGVISVETFVDGKKIKIDEVCEEVN